MGLGSGGFLAGVERRSGSWSCEDGGGVPGGRGQPGACERDEAEDLVNLHSLLLHIGLPLSANRF
jgi:hypothetical protein